MLATIEVSYFLYLTEKFGMFRTCRCLNQRLSRGAVVSSQAYIKSVGPSESASLIKAEDIQKGSGVWGHRLHRNVKASEYPM